MSDMVNADKKKILVIDDEMDLAEMMAESFNSEFTVSTADSIRSARAKISEMTFDLIITDLHLPDCPPRTSSVAMLREFKVTAPILLVTGEEETDPFVDQALKDGASGLVKKPFTLEELDEAVRKNLFKKEVKTPLKSVALKEVA